MQKRHTRKPPTKRHPAKTSSSTALVKRSAAVSTIECAQPAPANLVALGQQPSVSVSFIGALKLSLAQITALRRPVAWDEIDWKPSHKDGPADLPYLSHNGYRDRLDEAFGLGGWGMAPNSLPIEKDGVVYCHFALVIEGVPRAYAWGEQRYFATTRDGREGPMTYGDVLEACQSNAIVKCGKSLGIARELWDKRYLEELKARKLGSTRARVRQEPEERRYEPPVREHNTRQRAANTETSQRMNQLPPRDSKAINYADGKQRAVPG